MPLQLNIEISYDSKLCGQFALEVEPTFKARDVAMAVILDSTILNEMSERGLEKDPLLDTKTALFLNRANGKALDKDEQIGRLLEEGTRDLVLAFRLPPDASTLDPGAIKPPPLSAEEEAARATFTKPGGVMEYINWNA